MNKERRSEGINNPLEREPSADEQEALVAMQQVDNLRTRGNFIKAREILDSNPVVKAMFDARDLVLAKGKQEQLKPVPASAPVEQREASLDLTPLIEAWNKIGDYSDEDVMRRCVESLEGLRFEGQGSNGVCVLVSSTEGGRMYILPRLRIRRDLFFEDDSRLFGIVGNEYLVNTMIAPAEVKWEQRVGDDHYTNVRKFKDVQYSCRDEWKGLLDVVVKGKIR